MGRFDKQLADNPNYCPYCMRCSGLQRMVRVEPLFWKCPKCPAIHDDRRASAWRWVDENGRAMTKWIEDFDPPPVGMRETSDRKGTMRVEFKPPLPADAGQQGLGSARTAD